MFASFDNHCLRVSILTITLPGMQHLYIILLTTMVRPTYLITTKCLALYCWLVTDSIRLLSGSVSLFCGFHLLCFEFVVKSWPRGYKTFFMLNSAKHEIVLFINLKILTKFWNFFSWVEHEKSFKFLVFLFLWPSEISCSSGLSMKKVL